MCSLCDSTSSTHSSDDAEAACKAFKPDPAAVVRHTPRLQMPERVSTGGTASLQSASIANAAAYTGFGIGQHSLVSHRLDDTHMTINDEAQSSQHNAEVDSVDPIEAFAPAFVLEHGSQIPAPGLAVQPDGVQPATTALCASDCISKATVEMGGQKNATAVQDKERQGPAEGTWTGFAVDDSIAEGAGGAESSNDSLSNHHDSSTLSVQNNSSSGQDSLKCQDSSAVSSSAAALHSGTQLAHQNTDGITLGDAYYVPLSHQALPASSVASQPSNDPTSAGEVLHSRASDAYLTGISVGVPISRHTSQDRQAIVSRRPAQQSGITSARKALQAIALKAAAEAAYKVDSSNASPSGLQQPQSAMRRTASSSSRQSDGLWTPQSASTSQADQTGTGLIMHPALVSHVIIP